MWVGQEPPLDLADVAQAPLPPAPLAPSLSLHWLAVEGTQPNVPQNPSQSSTSKAKGGGSSSSGTGSDATPGLAHVLSREMQLVLTQVLHHAFGHIFRIVMVHVILVQVLHLCLEPSNNHPHLMSCFLIAYFAFNLPPLNHGLP